MKIYDYLMLTMLASVSCITFSACSDSDDEPGGGGSGEVQVPTVETYHVTNLTDNSAMVGGAIINNGGAEITAYGIVWDEESAPTVDLPTKTVYSGAADEFTSELTGLNAETTYYYRAYATNEAGTAYGEEFSFTTSAASELSVEVNGLTIDLVLVEGGTFNMGATDEEPYSYEYEKPVHKVTLDSYYIAKYEVSQALWIEIMGSNPSSLVQNNACPVDNVSYLQCLNFVQALNERTGLSFSLPTEAQWEYAARGGNKSEGYMYSGSDDATVVGWVIENMTEFGQHPCGEKAPNELGIYDMTGNVNEWCYDRYALYSADDQVNPSGPDSGSDLFVVRGGSYLCEAEKYCRNSKRMNWPSNYAQMDIGFRLVLNTVE